MHRLGQQILDSILKDTLPGTPHLGDLVDSMSEERDGLRSRSVYATSGDGDGDVLKVRDVGPDA